jgi:4,5-DOPA dioxygenase extradiol
MATHSGNILHNLREVLWEDTACDWALEFDAKIEDLSLSGDHQASIDYPKLGGSARLSVPTLDHYLPLLYFVFYSSEADSLESSRKHKGIRISCRGEIEMQCQILIESGSLLLRPSRQGRI